MYFLETTTYLAIDKQSRLDSRRRHNVVFEMHVIRYALVEDECRQMSLEETNIQQRIGPILPDELKAWQLCGVVGTPLTMASVPNRRAVESQSGARVLLIHFDLNF